jgi:hypothetical protein
MTHQTEPLALLRDTEHYLSALHGSVARHDNLAANYGCAGCELRDRIAAALLEITAAVSAAVAPPTDRAAVRHEADWIVEHCPDHGCVEPSTEVCHCEIADRLRRMADETATELADTLPAWLYQRFMPDGIGWDQLDEDDRSYWEHQARAVRRAVARGGFKQPAAGARQDGTET